MRYLVTGGAGFLGAHLVRRLLGRGDEVLVLDNLSTGHRDNIVPFASDPRYTFVFGDVALNPSQVTDCVARADAVFHLAAAVGVQLVIKAPIATIHTNVQGTAHVLEAASQACRKVFLVSTSEVYGRSEQIPFNEAQDLLIGPSDKGRWGYACSKLLDEFLALAYGRERQLPVVIVRQFNAVGPGQTGRYGMVVPRFVRQALAGEPLTVYGSGHQTRCFCHAEDVVDAWLRLMDTPEAVGRVFNVGSQDETSILALARLVMRTAGRLEDFRFIPYSDAYGEGFEDMPRRVPDLAGLRSCIGNWAPKHPLSEIVRDVMDYEQGRQPCGTLGAP